VKAQQGWRAPVQQAEHGGRHAQPLPCDHQQGPANGWLREYLFVSEG